MMARATPTPDDEMRNVGDAMLAQLLSTPKANVVAAGTFVIVSVVATPETTSDGDTMTVVNAVNPAFKNPAGDPVQTTHEVVVIPVVSRHTRDWFDRDPTAGVRPPGIPIG